jgi:hypothetical protein
MPLAPVPRVLVGGQPVVVVATPYAVMACALSFANIPPCVTGQWTQGASRVLVQGVPVAVQSGESVCTPTATPMVAMSAQTRVVAT